MSKALRNIATGGGQRLAGGQSVNQTAIVSADNEEVNIETTKTLYCYRIKFSSYVLL